MILAALRTAGFDVATAAAAYHALIELTIGSATIDSVLAAKPGPERARTYAEWRSDYAALDPARFPASVAASSALYPGSADERFEFALDLDRLLDGLEARSINRSPDLGATLAW
jgi:hypothetical protein